jgi:hypothetical protein
MAKDRARISDGATFEEVQALLLKCTRQLRALMPDGADVSPLAQVEAEMTWQVSLDARIAAHPKRHSAICCGSEQWH